MKWRLVGLWGLLSTTLSPSTVSELPVSPHLAAAMTCQFLCCKVLRPFSQSDCTYFSVQSFQNFSLFYQLPFECLTFILAGVVGLYLRNVGCVIKAHATAVV